MKLGHPATLAFEPWPIADPGLLILDEATSAVDPETEAALTQALERLSQGRTTLTIAHRLSTAERADYVLVFDRGGVDICVDARRLVVVLGARVVHRHDPARENPPRHPTSDPMPIVTVLQSPRDIERKRRNEVAEAAAGIHRPSAPTLFSVAAKEVKRSS